MTRAFLRVERKFLSAVFSHVSNRTLLIKVKSNRFTNLSNSRGCIRRYFDELFPTNVRGLVFRVGKRKKVGKKVLNSNARILDGRENLGGTSFVKILPGSRNFLKPPGPNVLITHS